MLSTHPHEPWIPTPKHTYRLSMAPSTPLVQATTGAVPDSRSSLLFLTPSCAREGCLQDKFDSVTLLTDSKNISGPLGKSPNPQLDLKPLLLSAALLVLLPSVQPHWPSVCFSKGRPRPPAQPSNAPAFDPALPFTWITTHLSGFSSNAGGPSVPGPLFVPHASVQGPGRCHSGRRRPGGRTRKGRQATSRAEPRGSAPRQHPGAPSRVSSPLAAAAVLAPGSSSRPCEAWRRRDPGRRCPLRPPGPTPD